MSSPTRLTLALAAAVALADFAPAQTSTPTRPPTGSPTTPATNTPAAVRPTPFTTFDHATPAVRDAVAGAAATAQTAVTSLDEAIRLGIVRPATFATAATPGLPPSVEALPPAVTRATTAIVTESRTTRAPELTRREAAVARLRAAQSDAERQRIVEELRAASGQRLEAQREDARLVRDRLRQLRDLTTLTRPSGS